jgi:hypothetical protein
LSSLNGCNQWSSFIRTCHTVQSENIVKQIDPFKSPNCLFILIDDENDYSKNTPDAQFPSKRSIEELLVQKTQSQIVHLNFSPNEQSSNSTNHIEFEHLQRLLKTAGSETNDYFAKCLQEFTLKLVLNAISTGAHVLVGKTYENIMVDVRVSNVKLYHRALGILKRLTSSENEKCENCLLRAIYDTDDLEKVDRTDIDGHIESATGKQLVVPKALIMLLTNSSLEKARNYLDKFRNSVRNCIFKLKNNQSNDF